MSLLPRRANTCCISIIAVNNLAALKASLKSAWQLLAKINGIADPNNLPTATQLKVVRGPFNAVIDLSNFELTLMLNGRYACRFPIGVGTDYPNLAGTYEIRNKTANPQYYGPGRIEIGADDVNNPLGEHWIGLGSQASVNGQPAVGGQIGIHGTNDPSSLRRTDSRGSIRLSNKDMDDDFGILSIGSREGGRR